MRRGYFLNNLIGVVAFVVSVCCLLVVMISVLRLPEVSPRKKVMRPYKTFRNQNVYQSKEIGKFGEMMIEMLPEDLPFTVFVPSERAFERDLRLRVNDSFVAEKRNNTYAIVSRILGFSAIPRTLSSAMVSSGEKLSYDSLSGFSLYISKDADGMLVVNRIRCERVDLRKREITVHIMDGAIMDAEFEQSVQPDYNEED